MREHDIKPRDLPFKDSISAGQHYLACVRKHDEWSLWRRREDSLLDFMLVGWQGQIEEDYASRLDWDPSTFEFHYVSPDDASLLIMGARHLTAKEAWWAFAKRHVDRMTGTERAKRLVG